MSGATKAPVEREADEVHPIILMQIIAPLASEFVLSLSRLATLTGIVRRDGNANLQLPRISLRDQPIRPK